MADTSFPKHKVLSWPAVPIPTPDEVYAGLTDQAKEYPLSLEAQLQAERELQETRVPDHGPGPRPEQGDDHRQLVLLDALGAGRRHDQVRAAGRRSAALADAVRPQGVHVQGRRDGRADRPPLPPRDAEQAVHHARSREGGGARALEEARRPLRRPDRELPAGAVRRVGNRLSAIEGDQPAARLRLGGTEGPVGTVQGQAGQPGPDRTGGLRVRPRHGPPEGVRRTAHPLGHVDGGPRRRHRDGHGNPGRAHLSRQGLGQGPVR